MYFISNIINAVHFLVWPVFIFDPGKENAGIPIDDGLTSFHLSTF